MRARPILLIMLCALAAACGPKLSSEVIAGRTIMITNGEETPITIQRVVANDSGERAECVDTPGAEIGPGRTYTVTFFYCDEVRELDVETDQGTSELDLG